jgi:hypothetical protein
MLPSPSKAILKAILRLGLEKRSDNFLKNNFYINKKIKK